MIRAATGGVVTLALIAAAGCRTVDPFPDLYDPEMVWRAQAAAALGAMDEPADVEAASYAMWRAWDDEDVPLVRYAIVTAFGQLGTARAQQVALAAMRDPDGRVRAAGALVIGRIGAVKHAPKLLQLLDGDAEPAVRAAAARALGDLEDIDVPPRLDEVPALIRHLDDVPPVGVAAHDALQRLTLQPLPRDRAVWQSWWDAWQAGPSSAGAGDAPNGG